MNSIIPKSSSKKTIKKDKRFIQNWRSLPLLNVDLKILFKTPADCIQKYLPFLISSNQIAYVEGRFISKDGRLSSDNLQVTDFLKLRGLVATVDIQKVFDSVNNLFLIPTLKKSALVKYLVSGYKYY